MSIESGKVGYKRPPARTRFQPGVSGNPTGRPKHRPTFRTALLEELAAPIRTEGSPATVSKLQALVKTLVAAAIAGNARAQALLVGAITRMGEVDDEDHSPLPLEDREILDAFVGGEVKRRTAAPKPSPATPGNEQTEE